MKPRRLQLLEKIIFIGIALLALGDGIFTFFSLLKDGANTTQLFVPLSKYVLIIFFLIRNKPAVEIVVNARSILGIVLSFGAPIFLNISDIHVHRIALPFVLGAFFYYSAVLLFALSALGNNFGVLPALRNITVKWPFSAIRHPMYGSYLHLLFLIALIKPTIANAILVGICFLGLYLRAQEEESVLLANSNYSILLEKVRRRFFTFGFSMPLCIASLFLGLANRFDNTMGEKAKERPSIDMLFAYPVYSINPLVYDEWHSVFLGNHIFRRLMPELGRSFGVTDNLKITCLESNTLPSMENCKRNRIEFKFHELVSCNGEKVKNEQLKEEFLTTIKSLSWILPNYSQCTSIGFDVCMEGPGLPDVRRRLQSLYLRFGWSHTDYNKPIGVGPYCLKVSRSDEKGWIYSGELFPHPDFQHLPVIRFDTTSDNTRQLDLALFGFTESGAPGRKDLHSHTPLGYYLITNSKYESSCLPWEQEDSVLIIQNHLLSRDLVFKEPGSLTELLAVGGKKKCPRVSYSKVRFVLPSFIDGCDKMAEELRAHWRGQGFKDAHVVCEDTTKLIMEKVVPGMADWDGYLSPLSPGYPGRNAMNVQYFSTESNMSWVPGSTDPELNYRLVGVGKSNITLNTLRFCDVRPSALGLGDLMITDLLPCQ